MITITRRQVRHLRGIFRRSVLGIAHRGPVPPLVLRVEGTQLRAHSPYAPLAVAHVLPGSYGPDRAIALPLDALAGLEGRDDSPVTLEAAAPDRTVVRWVDRGIPAAHEYPVPPLETLAPFPELPTSWVENPADLLDALAEAAATAADDSPRYALNCLLLRGARGEVVATDGRQLLVQGGFRFPGAVDMLVRRSPIFASRELPRDRPVAIGTTATHVVLRVGSWTLACAVQTGARFPRVDQVIPDASGVATRLRIDPGDAAFLVPALERLPGADEANAPATLDLNGPVAVRARGADQPHVTEVVLTRSDYRGSPVRLSTNRDLLARAIRLGFTALEIVDAGAPIVGRSGHRVFAWQPLSRESALGPSDAVIRVESTPTPTSPDPAPGPDAPPKARSPMTERTPPTPPLAGGPATDGNGVHASGAHPDGGSPLSGLTALIQETEALHEALGDARTRTGRLVAALRRHRKQARLMASTIAALKQLRLQDVAE